MNEPVLKFLQTLPISDTLDIDRTLNMFHEYNDILLQWNKTVNLISKNDIPRIWSRHYLDSIMAAPHITQPSNVIDLGAGAGLPGIPLKLLYPSINLSLLDSNRKSCQFLNQVKKTLKLDHIEVICERAEMSAKNTMKRESYDFAVTRAFAKPATALEMVIPFIKIGGNAIFWGSAENWGDKQFINKIALQLGAKYINHEDYTLPDDPDRHLRRLTIIQKSTETPISYPRAVGIPQKRPLN